MTVVLSGCAPLEPAASPTSGSSAPPGALTALPACGTEPAGIDDQVEGLILPDSSVVREVTRQDPLTNVTVWVPLTPEQFQRSYTDRKDVTILLSENEIYEAEMLITNGTHRNFLKAGAQCQTGSQVLVIVAPETASSNLPVPPNASPAPTPKPTP